MSAGEAARTFVEATRWEAILRARTEGLTSMVWGIVTAGLVVTMGFVGGQSLPGWALLVAWPPWVLAGYAMTHALWSTAALQRPALEAPGVLGYLVRLAAIVLLVAVLHWLLQPQSMAWPLAMIGGGWIATGLLGRRLSVPGRRTVALVGAALITGALVLSAWGPPDALGMLFAAALAGVVPLLAGLFTAVSG